MRLIDADELMRGVEKAENSMEYHGQEFSYSFLSSGQEISTEWYFVEELIENAPTIDAVPVVRCKDCKNCQLDDVFHDYWCNGKKVWAEHFCSYGERRDDAECVVR